MQITCHIWYQWGFIPRTNWSRGTEMIVKSTKMSDKAELRCCVHTPPGMRPHYILLWQNCALVINKTLKVLFDIFLTTIVFIPDARPFSENMCGTAPSCLKPSATRRGMIFQCNVIIIVLWLPLTVLWMCYECVMDDICYECVMNVLWICYECVMDLWGMCYGCVMDVGGMCYGCVRDVLWMCKGCYGCIGDCY